MFSKFKPLFISAILIAVTLPPSFSRAEQRIYASLSEVVQEIISTRIAPLLTTPVIVDSIKAQNAKHEALTLEEIIKYDSKWRSEIDRYQKPFITSILNNALSLYLKELKKQSEGLYSEIFVMDNKGLNVGQSDLTSDYWQGDEDKWMQTFLVGAGAIFADEIKFDDSSQQFQMQYSMSISDPETGQVIGAITIGFNAEYLEWIEKGYSPL